MTSESASGLDRVEQRELGEALRERYGDPETRSLPPKLESLLEALRDETAATFRSRPR